MHSHLTIDDRIVIARLHSKDASCRAIAKILGVHHTTVNPSLCPLQIRIRCPTALPVASVVAKHFSYCA